MNECNDKYNDEYNDGWSRVVLSVSIDCDNLMTNDLIKEVSGNIKKLIMEKIEKSVVIVETEWKENSL